MIGGEFTYDERLYGGDKVYYPTAAHGVYGLLVFIMTVLVTNLLIGGYIDGAFVLIECIMSFFVGIAVGDIATLMQQALVTRNDILFELLADYELLIWKVKRIGYCIGRTEGSTLVGSFYPALKPSKTDKMSCAHPVEISKKVKRFTEKMWDANEINIDQLEQQMDSNHELLKKIYSVVSESRNATRGRIGSQGST